MFAAAKCGTCHRFDGSGGATGPDLSNVAGRFSPRDLVEAMVLPSKVISDQYRAMNIFTTDGKVLSGRVTAETEQSVTLSVHAEDPTQLITIGRKEIEEIQPAKLSLMPEKLLHSLNREEVLDLIAYMLSRGDPQAGVFRSQ